MLAAQEKLLLHSWTRIGFCGQIASSTHFLPCRKEESVAKVAIWPCKPPLRFSFENLRLVFWFCIPDPKSWVDVKTILYHHLFIIYLTDFAQSAGDFWELFCHQRLSFSENTRFIPLRQGLLPEITLHLQPQCL
jgi:hypothetical protein